MPHGDELYSFVKAMRRQNSREKNKFDNLAKEYESDDNEGDLD